MATLTPFKFVVTKNIDNTFVFTVKQDASTLPQDLTNYSFVVGLYKINSDTLGNYVDTTKTLESSIAANGIVTKTLGNVDVVKDNIGGKITIVIPQADAATLVSDRGSKADRFYAKPTYSFIIEGVDTTDVTKTFIAKVNEVYVE